MSSKNMSKGFASIIILLGIAVIILIGGVVVYQKVISPQASQTPSPILTPTITTTPSSISQPSPTPDSTANWETYTNTKYNISFKYPSMDSQCCSIGSGIATSGEAKRLIVLADVSTVIPNSDAPFNGFGVFVDENPEALNLKEYLAGRKQALLKGYEEFSGKPPASKVFQETELTVSGREGILLKGDALWWAEAVYIPLPNENNILIIFKTEKSKGSFTKIFDQILSTFKFLD